MGTGFWRSLVVPSLCAALAGCGGGGPAAEPRPPDLTSVLHRSLLERQDLRGVGLDPADDTGRITAGQVNADPARPCQERLRSDAYRRAAVQSGFSSETVQVLQQSFSYRDVDAAEVVTQIRTAAKECRTYRMKTARGDAEFTVDRSFRLPALDGLDGAYAYCEQARTEKWLWWVCQVSLAHGTVISTLQVNAVTEKQTRDLLADLAPVAAHLLIKATDSR